MKSFLRLTAKVVTTIALIFSCFIQRTASKKKKNSDKTKLIVGKYCIYSTDCIYPELFCNQGTCQMRYSIGDTCTQDEMCLSGRCNDNNECEYSFKQGLIILMTVVASGILYLAASAPPSYRELYPQQDAMRRKVRYRNKIHRHKRGSSNVSKTSSFDLSDASNSEYHLRKNANGICGPTNRRPKRRLNSYSLSANLLDAETSTHRYHRNRVSTDIGEINKNNKNHNNSSTSATLTAEQIQEYELEGLSSSSSIDNT